MGLEGLKLQVSNEERDSIIENMLGKKFDGNVDFADFNESEIINATKRENAKNEIVDYIVGRIKEEYQLWDDGEALLKWDEYKQKHNLK